MVWLATARNGVLLAAAVLILLCAAVLYDRHTLASARSAGIDLHGRIDHVKSTSAEPPSFSTPNRAFER